MRRASWLAAAILLAACSPKGTVIPQDTARWGELGEKAKQLSEEDRRLFAAYMMRASVSGAFNGGKPAIPPGTTIGQAISDQKKFEGAAKKAEAEQEMLRAKAAADRAKAEAALNNAALVTIVSKNYIPKNIYADRFSDSVGFVIAIQNRTQKNIAGIKGKMQFSDMFGSEIKTLNLSMDDGVGAGKMFTTSNYSFEVNQFNDSDAKLAVTDLTKMKAVFHPEMIVFEDGTKLAVPAEIESSQ